MGYINDGVSPTNKNRKNKITDKQRIDAVEKYINSDVDSVLEIKHVDEGETPDETSIEMFTFDTQWTEGTSIRELLDKLVKQQAKTS